MSPVFFYSIIRFVVLVLLQALILNNINFSFLNVNPFLYILYILLLPFGTPKWLLLVLAFLLGFTLDVFTDSMGVFSAAAVATAYVRPFALRLLSPRDGYEMGTLPRIYYFGANWFTKYALVLVFIHNLIWYSFEVFSLQNLAYTLGQIIFSTLFTLTLIVLSQFIVYRK